MPGSIDISQLGRAPVIWCVDSTGRYVYGGELSSGFGMERGHTYRWRLSDGSKRELVVYGERVGRPWSSEKPEPPENLLTPLYDVYAVRFLDDVTPPPFWLWARSHPKEARRRRLSLMLEPPQDVTACGDVIWFVAQIGEIMYPHPKGAYVAATINGPSVDDKGPDDRVPDGRHVVKAGFPWFTDRGPFATVEYRGRTWLVKKPRDVYIDSPFSRGSIWNGRSVLLEGPYRTESQDSAVWIADLTASGSSLRQVPDHAPKGWGAILLADGSILRAYPSDLTAKLEPRHPESAGQAWTGSPKYTWCIFNRRTGSWSACPGVEIQATSFNGRYVAYTVGSDLMLRVARVDDPGPPAAGPK